MMYHIGIVLKHMQHISHLRLLWPDHADGTPGLRFYEIYNHLHAISHHLTMLIAEFANLTANGINLVSIMKTKLLSVFWSIIAQIDHDERMNPIDFGEGGTLGFLAVYHSVYLSVCPSVRQSTRCPSARFSELFSVILWDVDLKFGIWLCLDMIQIKFDFCLGWPTFTWVIDLFSVILCDIDLKFGIRLCLDLVQIKFDFCLGWPTFTWVIALCKNVRPLGFPNFSQSSFEILTWNLVYNLVAFCKNKFVRTFLSCLVILTWHLVYELVLT